VRADIVDAAIRATEKFGPDVSMDDIAREAGSAKPKLYRHFNDKTDLYNAVLERLTETLWTRIIAQANLLQDSMSDVLQHGVSEYLDLIASQPNLFRWIAHSGIAMQAAPDGYALRSLREISERIESVFRSIGDDGFIDANAIELIVFSVLGMAGTATEWWMGDSDPENRPMDADEFAEYLILTIDSIVTQGARMYGITIDSSKPLPLALSRTVAGKP